MSEQRASKITGLVLFRTVRRLRENFVLEYERLFSEHGDLLWFGWPVDCLLAFHPPFREDWESNGEILEVRPRGLHS